MVSILEGFHCIIVGFVVDSHICDQIWENLRMRFFPNIEFDVWLISPTTELTHVQVIGGSHALLWSYRALFVIAPHPQQSRNYGLKALLCTRMAFCILHAYRKSIKWIWVELFEMNVKIKQGSIFDLDNESRFFFDT